jgi:hypothetical protein
MGTAVLALVLFHPGVLNDGDSFSHVATGLWMIAHQAVPHVDPFSYTRAGAPWVAHEWLSELLFAGAFRLGGWAGVVSLTALAAAATFLQMGRHLARWLPAGPAFLVLFLAVACVAPEMLARPHILALPVAEAWVAGLFVARAVGRGPSWWLLPLMVLWANLHGGFIIGLALLGPLALEAMDGDRDRRNVIMLRWGAFGLAGLGCALLTPNGIEGILLPFRLSGVPELARVGEWQPANFGQLGTLELLLLIGLYLSFGRGARLPPVRLLLMLGLLHMALQHTRHLMLIGLIMPFVIAAPLQAALPPHADAARRRWPLALGGVAAVLLGARLYLPIVVSDRASAPVTALAHVPASLRAQPVLNDYAFGGYLIFAGVRPFIDARVELYGSDFLRDYAAITRPDRAALERALAANSVVWTILAPGNPALVVLELLPGWCRVSADEVAVVDVRCDRKNVLF